MTLGLVLDGLAMGWEPTGGTETSVGSQDYHILRDQEVVHALDLVLASGHPTPAHFNSPRQPMPGSLKNGSGKQGHRQSREGC